MRKAALWLYLLPLAIAPAEATFATQIPITNNTFSLPDVTPWLPSTTPAGWILVGATTAGVHDGGVADGGLPDQQFVYDDQPSGILRSSTVVADQVLAQHTISGSGLTYTLNYYSGKYNVGRYDLTTSLLIGGVAAASQFVSHPAGPQIPLILRSFSYTTTAADAGKSIGIEFSMSNTSGATQAAIDYPTLHVVPEPSTALLLGIGMMGLGMRRMRTRREC